MDFKFHIRKVTQFISGYGWKKRSKALKKAWNGHVQDEPFLNWLLVKCSSHSLGMNFFCLEFELVSREYLIF